MRKEDIIKTMLAVGHQVRISDPFSNELTAALPSTPTPPHVHRLRLMWMNMREAVLAHFPPESSDAVDIAATLDQFVEYGGRVWWCCQVAPITGTNVTVGAIADKRSGDNPTDVVLIALHINMFLFDDDDNAEWMHD